MNVNEDVASVSIEGDHPSVCFSKVDFTTVEPYNKAVIKHCLFYSSAVDFCQTDAILVIFSMGGYSVLSRPHLNLL